MQLALGLCGSYWVGGLGVRIVSSHECRVGSTGPAIVTVIMNSGQRSVAARAKTRRTPPPAGCADYAASFTIHQVRPMSTCRHFRSPAACARAPRPRHSPSLRSSSVVPRVLRHYFRPPPFPVRGLQLDI